MYKPFSLVLLLLSGVAGAQAVEVPSAETLAGCAACHGSAGQGNQALAAPPLAGQDAAYLARQLQNFKDGRRGYAEEDQAGRQMRAFASGLSAQSIASLAGYFAGLPAHTLTGTADVEVADGDARYQTTCAFCHGEQAQGYPQMQAPNLRILGGWYIDRQMENYVNGWRGAEAHADIQGMWMRSIATHLGSDEQQVVVAYIERLGSRQ